MKWLKRIFDFYLNASIHVALAILVLLHVTFQTLNITCDYHLSFFLFFGSISCYNFIKYGVEAEKYILVANPYYKGIQFLSFITLGLAIYHAYFLSLRTYLGIGSLILLTGLYALPVLPKAKNLRSWGGIKIFVVAIVWAGATVLLPVLSADSPMVWDVYVELFQRFILVFILLIPFEIRDLVYDSADLRTLPQRYGVQKIKFFGGFAILVFFCCSFLKNNLRTEELILKGVLCLILVLMILFTKTNQSKYYASFWVEAIPICWWGIMLITLDII